ncbi:MAG: LamG domain-containing protein [Candidatus Woesearchaeota archaeon]
MSRRKSSLKEIPDYSYAFLVVCLGLFLFGASYLLGVNSITGYAVKSGVWIELQDSSYIGGSAVFSNAVNSSLEYNVTGLVEVVTQTRDDFGIFDVYVDGMLADSVDTYSSDVVYDVRRSYNVTYLLEIYVTGNKNELSSGNYVVIDEVIGDGVVIENEMVSEESIYQTESENEIPLVKSDSDYTTQDATTAPKLSFLLPTPANGYSQTDNSTEVNISIIDSSDMNQFIWNWNGTNYTLYNNSLVLMYNFDNISSLGENSTKFVDMGRLGNNATCTACPAWTSSGKYGGAYIFDGLDDYMTVADSSTLDGYNEHTISVWVYPIEHKLQAITMKATPSWLGTTMGIELEADWSIRIHDHNTDNANILDSRGSNYSINTWTHLVYVLNATHGILYQNGNSVLSVARSAGTLANTDYPLSIGTNQGATYARFFNGTIDELQLLNWAMSPDQIQELYMSNLHKFNSTQWYLYVNQTKNSTSGLDAGTYTYYASAKDLSGNENSTAIRTINIGTDATPPTLSFVLPTPADGSSQTATFAEVNVSVTESQLNQFIWDWNNVNYTLYDNNLLLMMNFDSQSSLTENSTYVVDVSKYGNNGTVANGAIWTSSGKYNGAYQFDGANDYITIPDSSTLDQSGANGITFSVWAKHGSLAKKNWEAIMAKGDTAYRIHLCGELTACPTVGAFSFGSNGLSDTEIGTSIIPQNDVWYHVAVTYNGSLKVMYINGVQQISEAATGSISLNDYPLSIGENLEATGRYWNGSLDEFRMWNRSLSAAEISELYISNLQKISPTEWYFYVNQSKNATTGLDIGAYTYYGSAKDISGNEDSTGIRTLNIVSDLTPSTLSFASPTPADGSSQSATYAEVNVSVTESQLSQFIWNWNNTNYTIYNSSLILMMNFDNVSSIGENSTYVVDASLFGNNGTAFGTPVSNSTSKRGIAMQFDGTNDYVNAGSNFNIGAGFSASFWVQPYAIAPWDVILGKESWNAATGWLVYLSAVSGSVIYTKGGTDVGITAVGAAPVGRLTHIVVTNNNGAATIYVNGVLNSTGSVPISNSNTDLFVGARHGNDGTGVTDYLRGMIDEVRVWNRSLSANEVNLLYMSNIQKSSPTQWYFYANQTQNATTGLDAGTYTYYGSAKDVAGNENSTGIRTLTIGAVDTIPPTLSFALPTSSNGTSQTATSTQVNVSVVESQLSQFIYNWNNTNYTIYDNSLLLMYNFDNVSTLGENNNYIVDFSSSGNNGTIEGSPLSSSGRYGRALQFDGINDYVNVSEDSLDVSAGENFTFIVWINTGFMTGSPRIFGKRLATGDSKGYECYIHATQGSVNCNLDVGSSNPGISSTKNIADNQWHHIAVTLEGTTGTIYVDGVVNGTNNNSVLDDGYDNNVTFKLGFPFWLGVYYNGTMDEARIWNRSLSSDEIQQSYMSNLNRFNTTQWYFYANQSKNATSGLDIGTYTYYGSAKDVAGNENSTGIRILTIGAADTIPPTLSFASPTSNNGTSNATSTQVNISIAESQLSQFIWNWNNTNYTMYNDSLVLMMNFDSISSLGENTTKAVDVSKYGNNGTIIGATYSSSGKHNGAYSFDGNDYVNITDSSNLRPAYFTIQSWIKIASTPTSYHPVVEKYYGSAANRYSSYYLAVGSTETGIWIGTTDNSWNKAVMSGYPSVGVWHHLVGTYNGTELIFYLDGVLNSNLSVSKTIDYNSQPLYIGQWGLNQYFNGLIDEVRIWNRSMSAAEVYQQYVSNLNRFNTSQWYFYANQSKNATTGLDVGAYTYYGSAKDLNNNENSTAIRTITVISAADTTAPTVNSVRNYTNDRITYTFSVSSSETGTCTLYGNFTGGWAKNESKSVTAATAFNFTSFALLANTTNYFWGVNCSDASANVGWSVNTSFTTKDIYAPNVYSVRNWTNDRQTYTFSLISSETGSCTLYGNFTGSWAKNESKSVTAATAFNFTSFALLANTTNYFWGVNCSDSSSNVVWAANTTFTTKDAYAPNVYSVRNYTNDRLTYTFSAISSEAGSCTLYADFSGSWAKNQSTSVTANTAFNFTSLLFNVSRTYTWGVNCSDVSGNTGWSANTTFKSINHLPTASNVAISPSVVSTSTSSASGTWAYSDSDSDNENATVYEWYVNGTNGWKEKRLLAYWKLDQNVIDYSGSHNGVTNLVTNVTGKIKQAYSLDGSSSYIKASGFPELGTNEQSYTYSAWFKVAQGETDGNIIHVSSSTDGFGWCLPPLSIDNSKVKAYSWNGAGVQTHSATNILSGIWYHTATTWDVTNGLRVYVNGILENSTTQLTYSASGANNYVWMAYGIACAGNEGWFNGSIDEVMVWNRSLSAEEINDLYNMTLYGQIDHTGANHTISNLTSNYYSSAGTTLMFGVTPYDGVDYGTQVNSTVITVIETTAPVVSVISSANNTVDDDGSVAFSYNVTDASSISNCSLIVEDVSNATNSSIAKSTALQFNAILAGGAYDWYVNCTDTYGNTGKSETRRIIVVELTTFEGVETSNISSLDITNISNFIVSEPVYGKINFTQALDLSAGADIDRYVNITYNRIEIDSTSLPSLNKSAMLILYNLSFTAPQILKNDALCSSAECSQLNYTGGNLTFNVSHFTKYSARETPSAGGSTGTTGSSSGTGSSGSGGGSGSNACKIDTDCDGGYSCFNNACVKLFDVKIIKFPSPVRAGQFFDFTYLIKGMADIKGDVIVKFSILKDGAVVSSGQDTIYLGSFEQKTESTNIFLPSDAVSGKYDFFVSVDYAGYIAKAQRLIEVQVVDSKTPLGANLEVNLPLSEQPSGVLDWFMTFLMFLIAILLVLAGYHYESREHIFERAHEIYSGFMVRVPEKKLIAQQKLIVEQEPIVQQKPITESKPLIEQKPVEVKSEQTIVEQKPIAEPTIENSDNRLIIIEHLIDDAYKQLSSGQMYDAEASYYKIYELYNLLPEELKVKVYQKCIDLRTKLESASNSR